MFHVAVEYMLYVSRQGIIRADPKVYHEIFQALALIIICIYQALALY